MSRLGRDYIQTGYYIERYFPEKQVRYISLLDGIDTGVDSAVNDLTPFRAIFNDLYAKDISKKIKSVKRDKQRRGLFIGGKAPYGYRLSETEKNRLFVDPDAAAVVAMIFAMAVEGQSARSIAAALNARGVPSPAVYAGGTKQTAWSAERVAAMLRNRMYTGDMVQGTTRKVSYKSKKCVRMPKAQWIIVPNTHTPLVEQAVFAQVQRLLDSRVRVRVRTYDYLLKGLIVCEECGHPLGVANRVLAGGVEVLYFICRTYQRYTKEKRCTCHCVRVDAVTALVTQAAKPAAFGGSTETITRGVLCALIARITLSADKTLRIYFRMDAKDLQ